MTIDELGSAGEIVAAIATVATLAYLATQIRHSSRVALASTAAAHAERLNSVSLLLGQSPELAKLYFDGLAGKALSEAETRQFEMLLGSYVTSMHQSYSLGRHGLLDPEFSTHRDSQLEWLVSQPGFQLFWAVWGESQPPEFAARVARISAALPTSAQQATVMED
jgi:hypothetical protein